jgi:hypothetical protein
VMLPYYLTYWETFGKDDFLRKNEFGKFLIFGKTNLYSVINLLFQSSCTDILIKNSVLNMGNAVKIIILIPASVDCNIATFRKISF